MPEKKVTPGTKSSGEAAVYRELRQATKGLLYPSEADKPVKAVFWTKDDVGAETVDAVAARRLLKAGTDEPVRTMSLDEFFAPVKASAGWDEEHKTNADRFQALRQWVETHLKDVQVYRVGDVTAHVLLIGNTEAGDFAGLSTMVVET